MGDKLDRNVDAGEAVKLSQNTGTCFAFCMLGFLSLCLLAFSQTAPAVTKTGSQEASAQRDGEHDFDFNIGTWKTHIRRLQHPLTGSKTWIEYDGTHIVQKVWNGSANLGELEIDGPTGHIEALSLRLYNPESHQWSLNFARSSDGTLGTPMFGEFKGGQGEFIDQETFNGRSILIRNIWSDITPDSSRSVWSYSDDGGKTWEENWIATDTRVKVKSYKRRRGE